MDGSARSSRSAPAAPSEPGENVRLAQAGDLDRLGELWREARRQLATARGGTARLVELDEVGLGEPSLGGDAVVLVGSYAGVVVGFAALRWTCPDHSAMALELLFVEPEARGVGVGGGLLEACLRRAGDEGAAVLDAPALPGDRETKSLLEAAGFKARLVVMARPLGRPGSA